MCIVQASTAAPRARAQREAQGAGHLFAQSGPRARGAQSNLAMPPTQSVSGDVGPPDVDEHAVDGGRGHRLFDRRRRCKLLTLSVDVRACAASPSPQPGAEKDLAARRPAPPRAASSGVPCLRVCDVLGSGFET
eukprot:10945623-Alexandrium_andersonii.AAC.1